MIKQEIKQKLYELSDEKYKKFHSSLCPNIDSIIGVRVPILREFAKELYKNYSLEELGQIDDEFYEELVIQGMIIGFQTKEDINIVLKQIENFVPKINSWAVCDTFCAGLKITKKNLAIIFEFLKRYLNSNQEYEVRFTVVMLLDYYINDEYIDKVLEILQNIKLKKYYVQMAVAWALSICLIKYYDKTLIILKGENFDTFTYNKAIQKAIESYRICDYKKEYLKKLKT